MTLGNVPVAAELPLKHETEVHSAAARTHPADQTFGGVKVSHLHSCSPAGSADGAGAFSLPYHSHSLPSGLVFKRSGYKNVHQDSNSRRLNKIRFFFLLCFWEKAEVEDDGWFGICWVKAENVGLFHPSLSDFILRALKTKSTVGVKGSASLKTLPDRIPLWKAQIISDTVKLKNPDSEQWQHI